jgi:hypothetical protein
LITFRWLAVDEDDGQIVRELTPKHYLDSVIYNISIKTGGEPDAGTSANVFIRLIGNKGQQTTMIQLEVTHQRRYFQPGSVELFSLEGPDLGDLEFLELEHDGNTVADGWFVDDITVEVAPKGRTFYFPCHHWLSKHKDDGKTKRILKVQDFNKTLVRSCKFYLFIKYKNSLFHLFSCSIFSQNLYRTY